MKFVFALLMLSAFQAQANEAVCWEAQSVPFFGVPKLFCVDSIVRDGRQLQITSGESVYTTERLETLDSDAKTYETAAIVAEDYETCGTTYQVKLKVVAQQSMVEGVESWSLNQVEARYVYTSDNCHRRPQQGVVPYTLK